MDNTAVQDGFQLYTHNFIVSDHGDWTVIQQGMSPDSQMARRYHWHSGQLQSFVEEPHAAVCGENVGPILNLTAKEAASARAGMLGLTHEKTRADDAGDPAAAVALAARKCRRKMWTSKRLGTVLWMAQ